MEKINPYYRNMMIKVNEEIDEKLVFELDSLLADLATKYSYNSTRWIYLYSTSKEDRIYFKNNVQYEDRNKKYKLTMNDDIIAFFKNLNEVVKYLKDTINYKRFLEQELKIFYKHIAFEKNSCYSISRL